MNIAIELPDDIARQLETEWRDVPRRALEAIALEGYRSGALTHRQVQRMLNLSWWETETFLKERQAYLRYDEADLAHDRATLDRLLAKGITIQRVPHRRIILEIYEAMCRYQSESKTGPDTESFLEKISAVTQKLSGNRHSCLRS